MDPHLNNYVLQRASAVFKDVNLPPKKQEVFDMWPKVRRLIITDPKQIVGGQYYTLRTVTQEGASHTSLKARVKPFKFEGAWCVAFELLSSEAFNGTDIIVIRADALVGSLYRTCAATQHFLALIKNMHPAQFYSVVSGEHYDLEFFNKFRELQL